MNTPTLGWRADSVKEVTNDPMHGPGRKCTLTRKVTERKLDPWFVNSS